MKSQATYYCNSCGPVGQTRVEERKETYSVKGNPITIDATVRICARCNSPIYDRELDSENIEGAYDIYRRQFRVITPEDIKSIRETYGLSQRALGMLLGWGESTVHRYETGAIADESHNQVLRFIKDPFNMMKLFEENSFRLPPLARVRLESTLNELLSSGMALKLRDMLEARARQRRPDILNGYREFSLDKLGAMISYFSDKRFKNTKRGVWKTMLNKLLWYADFAHFLKYTTSISGALYVHLDHGPVPDQYERYLSIFREEGMIETKEKTIGDYEGELIVAVGDCVLTPLSASALDALDAVYDRFKLYTATQIRNLSHKEKGYKDTEPGCPISYQYADVLKVTFEMSNVA